MKQASRQATMYWDETIFRTYLNAADVQVTQPQIVTTTFADDGPRAISDNYTYMFTIGGFSDFGTTLIDEILDADLRDGADHYYGLFPLTTAGVPTEGAIGYEGIVRPASRPLTFQTGQAAGFTMDAAGAGGLTRPTVLRSASITGIGNGTGFNLGATVSGQTTQAVFRVVSGTFSSITMHIQESSDDGGGDLYATLAALNPGAITAAGVVRTTTTGATEAWKRVNVSAFTGTNAVVVVTLGVVAE